MIKTAVQLKAKIQNLSGSDSQKAQALIRVFIMERFLERLSVSDLRDRFILKGGMLVASAVGIQTRTTMDIDVSIQSLPLTKENIRSVIDEIIGIDIQDGVLFRLNKITDIMEEHEYPGIRCVLDAYLGKLHQPFKIDISAGDVITPAAIEYSYHLMLENRDITLWTYNIETLLAEKLETIMSRGTANSRMRDYYDIYVIGGRKSFDLSVLHSAFIATCQKRNTAGLIPEFWTILDTVKADDMMRKQWNNFRNHSFYVGELSWHEVMERVICVSEAMLDGSW